MSIGIDELFDMLSWNSDEETQKKGRGLAKDVKSVSVFLQPCGPEHSKDVWENCARILFDYPDEILKHCMMGLLTWLEDMNWPGAEIILQRLLKFQEAEYISVFIVHCVKEALACDNQSWLGNLAALMDNIKIRNCLPTDVYNVLSGIYHE